MIRNSILTALAATAFVIAGAALAQQNPPVSPSPVKRTILGKVEMPNSNYEVLTAMLEIAPGFKAGRHLHPGIVFGHVLEGEFWMAPDGEAEKVLKAGEGLTLADKAIHNEGNASSDKPVKLVVTYVVEKGQPLVIPVK